MKRSRISAVLAMIAFVLITWSRPNAHFSDAIILVGEGFIFYLLGMDEGQDCSRSNLILTDRVMVINNNSDEEKEFGFREKT